jgi:hypothetical protein
VVAGGKPPSITTRPNHTSVHLGNNRRMLLQAIHEVGERTIELLGVLPEHEMFSDYY